MTRAVAFVAGLAAGIKVTRRLHTDPEAGKWGERLGATRLRYANLPVGGTLAITASLVLPGGAARPVRALGLGALAGALGWGFVDPLPEAYCRDTRSRAARGRGCTRRAARGRRRGRAARWPRAGCAR